MLAGKSTPPRRPDRPLLWKFRGARLVFPPGFASDHFEPARAVGVFDECPASFGADHAQAFLVQAERGAVIVWLGKDQVQRTCQTLALVREVVVVRDVAQHDGNLARGEVERSVTYNTAQNGRRREWWSGLWFRCGDRHGRFSWLTNCCD